MKRIIFKKIQIKNFLSIGENKVSLNFKSGINLITGENRDKGGRNGVGKSTLVESLFWCLFGSTMRDIKKDRIIHNQVKKGCEVILNFDINDGIQNTQYTITRTLEPSSVKLEVHLEDRVEDRVEDISLSSMPKTDDYIKELIGANEEVFQNAVIMTANNTTPFMGQKKIDKRKFVEGILNLGIFGEILLKVRADYNDTKKENDIVASKFIDQQKNLTLYKNQVNKNTENRNNKILNLKDKIKNNQEKIDRVSNNSSVTSKIDSLKLSIESKEKDLNDLEEGHTKIKDKISGENGVLLQIDYEIKQLEKQKGDLKKGAACPTCKRKYDESLDLDKCIKEIDDQISPLEDSKQPVKSNLQKLISKEKLINNAITSTRLSIKNLNTEKSSLELASQELNQLQERNREIEEEINELRNEKDGVLELIDNIEIEIIETEKTIQELQKKLNILENAKYIVSEEGVKTYIIKKMLGVLNARLNYYLNALEAPCKCEFNEMFEEIIHNDQGKECSYFNFSGGERKRIDLAVLFMFQDLLRTQTGSSFSLSMYDELFDSAIDERGANKIMEILNTRVADYNESVYIISHNKTHISGAGVSNIITLEKHNGKTQIKES
jgi:DNA repair exonuclease SbcCD ATPase subunit